MWSGGRLFETNSDIKTMFAKLKDYETVAELRSSKILEDHSMKVICTIDDAIANLDDMEYVNRMLQTIAQAHSTRFPNFDPEFFMVRRYFSDLSSPLSQMRGLYAMMLSICSSVRLSLETRA